MSRLRPAVGLAKSIGAIGLLVALGMGALVILGTAADPVIGPAAGAARFTPSQAPEGLTAIDLSPSNPAEEPPGGCVVYVTSYDSVPLTAERVSRVSTSVIIGTVEQVGPARWRTADEKAPNERQDLGADVVMRMLRISVDDNLAGAKSQGTIVVWIDGGVIGCHEFEDAFYPLDVKAGDRYAFFLDANRNPLKDVTGVARVVQMWAINGDSVTTPVDGQVNVSEVASQVRRAIGQP